MENILIAEVRSIRLANAKGIGKMLRNILALHQSLRSIDAAQDVDAGFERACRFYTLFFLGPSVGITLPLFLHPSTYSTLRQCWILSENDRSSISASTSPC